MRLMILPMTLFALAAQQERIDEAYTAKIREYTTEEFFSTELVDYLPASDTVPTPFDHLGHIVGAPDFLAHSSTVNEYMYKLAEASPRVHIERLGMSEEGREMVVVFISDDAHIADLDKYKAINAKLGDPRVTTDEEAEELLEEALPIYWVTAGLHAPETGPPEMVMEMAYRLAVSDRDNIKEIRDNSIVMITPVLDVDGRDRVVDLYNYRKANPDKPQIPLIYWGKYVAHDNNRDGMMLTLELSKGMTRKWLEYKPLMHHDLHESVPYLYISTGTGPYNPWLDPITIDEWHQLAYNEVGELTRRGVPGVWTHGFYDGWAANYGITVAHGHNGIGRFYETYSGGGADTGVRNTGSNTRQWYRPNPAFPKARWSLRNNTNLMQSGVLLGLQKVAREREKFMRNFWLKSKRSVAKPTNEGPAAYVFPADDPNYGNQMALLDALKQHGVEVQMLEAPYTLDERELPRKTRIIRMDQPYSRLVDMMLDKQYYNAEDPRSYDDTGWQLGPLFNTEVIRVTDPTFLEEAEIGPVRFVLGHIQDPRPFGQISESNGIPSYGAAEPRSDHDLSAAFLRRSETRIAFVHTWQSTQDEGWARIALDQLDVEYDYVSVHELRDNPDLNAKYDVILMPQARGSAQSIVNGRPMVGDPIPWKQTDDMINVGGPDSTDDIRGGIELEGVLNLRNFVQKGGLLVCIGNMARIPIEYGIVNGVSVRDPEELNAPGGVYLTDKVDKDSKVLSGYGDNLAVYFNGNSLPILSTGGGGFRGGGSRDRVSGRGSKDDPDVAQGRGKYDPVKQEGDTERSRGGGERLPRPRVLLKYAKAEELLVAGMITGEEELAGQAALIDCQVGEGHVLLFSFNPFWRGQTIGSYSLFFNAALFRDQLDPEPKKEAKITTNLVPVGLGWAKNSVNATVFREASVTSHEDTQYVGYYNPEGEMVLAKRQHDSTEWTTHNTGIKANTSDAHNGISIAVDGSGLLHVSWDHHGHPLRYATGVKPGSLELTEKKPMNGEKEGNVTYPQFFTMAEGGLIFFYRDGSSGNGNLVLKRYNLKSETWQTVQSNLIDGEGQRNAYWQACVDDDGAIHLSWVWRETGDVATNHDMCYAVSRDGGKSWERSDGTPYKGSINEGNAEVVSRIPQNSELINQTSMAVDAEGRPIIASYWRPDGAAAPQVMVITLTDDGWETEQASRRNLDFTLRGFGTRGPPMSRPQVVLGEGGPLVVYRDEEFDTRVVLLSKRDGKWSQELITEEGVGRWEPTYDRAVWRSKGELHLFHQEVAQVEAEGIADNEPTMVSILEVVLNRG
jgi:hypothetical protein